MAISQTQADTSTEFHAAGIRACDSKQGPMRFRRNGRTQRWKRDAERFRVPVKHGLYSHFQITNDVDPRLDFHAIEDCPAKG